MSDTNTHSVISESSSTVVTKRGRCAAARAHVTSNWQSYVGLALTAVAAVGSVMWWFRRGKSSETKAK